MLFAQVGIRRYEHAYQIMLIHEAHCTHRDIAAQAEGFENRGQRRVIGTVVLLCRSQADIDKAKAARVASSVDRSQ